MYNNTDVAYFLEALDANETTRLNQKQRRKNVEQGPVAVCYFELHVMVQAFQEARVNLFLFELQRERGIERIPVQVSRYIWMSGEMKSLSSESLCKHGVIIVHVLEKESCRTSLSLEKFYIDRPHELESELFMSSL